MIVQRGRLLGAVNNMNALCFNQLELVGSQGLSKNIDGIFGVISVYGHPAARALISKRQMVTAIAIVLEGNQR